MQSNKKRIYIALFDRGNHRGNHWAFWIGPKCARFDSRGTLYQVINRPTRRSSNTGSVEWFLDERRSYSARHAERWLFRVLIGKVQDMRGLTTLIGRIPVTGDQMRWVQGVFEACVAEEGDVMGRMAVREWETLREACDRRCAEYYRSNPRGRPDEFIPGWDMFRDRALVQ